MAVTLKPGWRNYNIILKETPHTPEEQERINRKIAEWKYNVAMRQYKEKLEQEAKDKGAD